MCVLQHGHSVSVLEDMRDLSRLHLGLTQVAGKSIPRLNKELTGLELAINSITLDLKIEESLQANINHNNVDGNWHDTANKLCHSIESRFTAHDPLTVSIIDTDEAYHKHGKSPKSKPKRASKSSFPTKRAPQDSSGTKHGQKRQKTDKNQLCKDDDDEYGSEDDHGHFDGSGKTKEDGNLAFACPFFRCSPLEHMECMGRKLSRIRDVKQHIHRKHAQSDINCSKYSPTPRKSEFDEHTQSRTGKRRAQVSTGHLDSHETLHLLEGRVDRKLSPRNQWYAVWDILFSNKPRPPRPYLGTMAEESVLLISDICQRESSTIIPSLLEKNGIPVSYSSKIQSVMMGLFDETKARVEGKTNQSQHCSNSSLLGSSGGFFDSSPAISEPYGFFNSYNPSPAPMEFVGGVMPQDSLYTLSTVAPANLTKTTQFCPSINQFTYSGESTSIDPMFSDVNQVDEPLDAWVSLDLYPRTEQIFDDFIPQTIFGDATLNLPQ